MKERRKGGEMDEEKGQRERKILLRRVKVRRGKREGVVEECERQRGKRKEEKEEKEE